MRSVFTKPTPPGPRDTKDFKRILELPQRDAESTGAAIAGPLTEMLKKPNGEMILRSLQALALAEASDFKGALLLLPVGHGKTLVSYLLPTVLKAQKPLLLVPGKLKQKTQKEFKELSKHWKTPKNKTLKSSVP